MTFDFLNSLASQRFLGKNEDVGVESDIDVKVETERTSIRTLGSENDDTVPQPKVTREWFETLNDVTVEEFSFFTGSFVDFDTISSP